MGHPPVSVLTWISLANVKNLIPAVEQLLVNVREDSAQLIQLLLAQREVLQSSKAIELSIGEDRASIDG